MKREKIRIIITVLKCRDKNLLAAVYAFVVNLLEN